MRKFYVGLISLIVVIVLFMLYNRLGTTTQSDTGKQTKFIDTIKDINDADLEKQISSISDVGVGTVEKAVYIKRGKNQQVEREWGFEKLLNESRNIWEIEKPFMNIYQRNFTCYITADTGKVQVETAVGKSTPKDATFTSNVLIHIVPSGSGNIKESHIYLDDITFLSEKSLLTTANSVRFITEDARMFGKGLELVYDDVRERLEYLWIKDLESLYIKEGTPSDSKKQSREPAKTDNEAEVKQSKETAVASDKKAEQADLTKPVPEKEKTESYKCLFSKNVLIDSPEQMVFAHNEIFIDDILWKKSSDSDPNNAVADTQTISTDQPNKLVVTATDMPGPDEVDMNTESNGPPDKLQDITITCDNGFIIALKDYPKVFEKIPRIDIGLAAQQNQRPEKFNNAEGRKTFLAPKIDYNAFTGDIISNGASELKFYTVDLGQSDANKPPLPVTVTAKKQVRFLPTSNLAVFEGGCLCDVNQTDSNFQQEYKLLAPRLNIELAEETDERSPSLAPGIKHFTADGGLAEGGLVMITSLKKAGKKILGGTKLESRKFDYDPEESLFVASGPGMIIMDNSKISPSIKENGRFSLRKPCYVVVREYETLKYFIKDKRIIADAGSESLIIDYFPVVDGKYQFDQKATVYTPYIEVNLTETASGQLKLLTLSATGGIIYEDQDKKFDGSTLFYDAGKSIVTVKGDESWPCHYNGANAGSIEWNIKTNEVKTEVVGPAILQLR
jgi:hypothetical protein